MQTLLAASEILLIGATAHAGELEPSPPSPTAIEGEREKRPPAGRQGRRDLMPALVAEAQDETTARITRIVLTFVGVILFCLLSLWTPDSALLTPGDRLNLPFAGPVSLLGFMFVGPLVLVAIWLYLQIYAEHWLRLEAFLRWHPAHPRTPTLAPLRNQLLRIFIGFVLYPLLPLAMLYFAWKAAVFPVLGAGLLCTTVAVSVGAVLLGLPLRWSWQIKALLSVVAALLALTAIAWGKGPISEGPIRRPFVLFRADFSGEDLRRVDVRGATLQTADLREADLTYANLQSANLADALIRYAKLDHANLEAAELTGGDLKEATLTHADLTGANLQSANLAEADLQGVNLTDTLLSGTRFAKERLYASGMADPTRNLTQAQIDVAWAWADQPPLGLDYLNPPLTLPEARLCDPALRNAWAAELYKRPQGERSYGPPAGCSHAAGATAS